MPRRCSSLLSAAWWTRCWRTRGRSGPGRPADGVRGCGPGHEFGGCVDGADVNAVGELVHHAARFAPVRFCVAGAALPGVSSAGPGTSCSTRRTGRGKTHLAAAPGTGAVGKGMNVRFLPTAELVLRLGRAKRDGTFETMPRDIAKADLIILDEFGYVPFDIDGAGCSTRSSPAATREGASSSAANIESRRMGHDFCR